jgi:ABC-type lipoprotein export system ATPase subunit
MEELVQPINSQAILGVLEQIQKVNYMIDLHRLHNEQSMVLQFERQREGFLEEFQNLLSSLHIKANLTIAA